jgi:hypothetical protein
MNIVRYSRVVASVLGLCFLLIADPGESAQVATDPGDYRPLPAGIDLGIVYYQNTTWDEVYANGNEVPAGLELKTQIGLLRWVHYIEIGGMIADPQIIVPFGSVALDSAGGETKSSGVGDPIFGGTLWVYNDTESKSAFGLTALLSLPLGQYDADKGPVNIGENRWKLIMQGGYVTQLADTVSLDVIGEYTIFGENDDFAGAEREQEDQYGIQLHLAKQFNSTTSVSLSYYHDFGAETTINGVDQDDELDNSSWQTALTHFVTKDKQLMFEYGSSIDTENGFAEGDRFNIRFVKVF